MMDFTEVPGFVCNYQIEVQPELPGDATKVYRFGPPESRGRDECLIKVRTQDGEWTGAFRGGEGGVSAAMSTPSPHHFFLSVTGQGYWVDTEMPEATEVVRAYPLREVKAIPDAGVLVCVDDTDLLVFNRFGATWASRRIASDGLRITRADALGVWCEAWDAAANKDVGFFVDLATGAVEGGVVPEDE